MATKKVWIGSVGPYLFDDSDYAAVKTDSGAGAGKILVSDANGNLALQDPNSDIDITISDGYALYTKQITAIDGDGVSIDNDGNVGILIDDDGDLNLDEDLKLLTGKVAYIEAIKAIDGDGVSIDSQASGGILIDDDGDINLDEDLKMLTGKIAYIETIKAIDTDGVSIDNATGTGIQIDNAGDLQVDESIVMQAGKTIDGTDLSAHVSNVTTVHLPSQASAAGKILGSNGTVASWGAAGSGTVTAVTGTAPVVSSEGTTPDISMLSATAARHGYMTSTFASKLDGIAEGADVTGTNWPKAHNNSYHSTNYATETNFNNHVGSGDAAHADASTIAHGFMTDTQFDELASLVATAIMDADFDSNGVCIRDSAGNYSNTAGLASGTFYDFNDDGTLRGQFTYTKGVLTGWTTV